MPSPASPRSNSHISKEGRKCRDWSKIPRSTRQFAKAFRGSSRATGRQYFLERGRNGEGIEELWKDLGASGLLGVHLPEEYGGGGGGMAEAVVVVEELAANGMPMLIWVISPAICGSILAHHGSEAMKREWLPDLADGSRKMAFGLTEPDAGSNSHKVATTARRTATGWTLSGSKYYISAVDQAEALLVVAKDVEHSTPEKSALSLFVVPDQQSRTADARKIPTSIVSPDKQFTRLPRRRRGRRGRDHR